MKAIINRKATLAVLGILAVVALTACGQPDEVRSEPNKPDVPNGRSQHALVAPIMVCVLVDFSASIAHYGVKIPTVSDLTPLIDSIDRFGGELAVGTIQEDPSTPLLRLRLPPRERGLQPPSQSVDVFTRRKLVREFEKAQPEFEERERLRRAGNRALIEDFVQHLDEYLKRGATAQATDLWGNVRRCDTFLQEDVLYWMAQGGQEPARHLLIVSDGRHNVDSSSFWDIDKGVTVTAVSGARGLGSLSEIKRLRWFESARAAVSFIVTQIERNKK